MQRLLFIIHKYTIMPLQEPTVSNIHNFNTKHHVLNYCRNVKSFVTIKYKLKN